ncbi:hypothetical protein M9H77_07072 [Catharanthus roseus]|uniref:Uncharacterized protein n=1 Tax=Catharanthus roseus TaxID=4058 RepID=A0ACC0BU52_CATRO|nr:hypothetical protein M9H77_07072 [Catharanthus roseus]
MREHSWVCTLVTQILICSVLFIIIKIGETQNHVFDGRPQRRPLDVLFLSVLGGHRRVEEQFLLIKQMAKVTKVYNAQFVVNISELGEEDPLAQNATGHFQSLNIPWYSTKTLKGHGVDHYLKQVKIPYGTTLDLIAVNSGLFQGPPTGARKHQLIWLTKTLKESISDWRVVVGFHPVSACNGTTHGRENFEDQHHIFLRYGVNLYLSGLACAEYVQKEGAPLLNNTSKMEKGPYLISVDKMSLHHKGRVNGFLLHRVSPLEFVTYVVNLRGEVVERSELQQRGEEVMYLENFKHE